MKGNWCDHKMTKFVFYDTETTGLIRDFDQILQFAAVLTDENLRELDRFEVRCQCLPWIVPSPMALWVTGVRPSMLGASHLPSFYKMMETITVKLNDWSPSVFLGYNTIHFDEPLLQRALWQALQPPYLTVINGNSRMDVLPLVKALSHLMEGALKYPKTTNSRIGFRLDALAPLNGFEHENAHDALADVEATIYIARIIKERAPELWKYAVASSPKSRTANILRRGRPVLVVEHYMNGPSVWWGQRGDASGVRGAMAHMFRLSTDWALLSNSDDSELLETLKRSPKPLRQLGLNKAPLVYEEDVARTLWGHTLSSDELLQSRFLIDHPGFADHVMSLADLTAKPWPKAVTLEQKIFESFPSKHDELSMKRFRQGTPSEQANMIDLFEDERYRQLAQRIVYTQWPELLEGRDVSRLEEAISERLNACHIDKNLWRTIDMAREELEAVQLNDGAGPLVAEFSAWLDSLEGRFSILKS